MNQHTVRGKRYTCCFNIDDDAPFQKMNKTEGVLDLMYEKGQFVYAKAWFVNE
jgi:hypothetical protein